MTTLIKLEITRALRNKKFMFFTVVYPSALFLVIAGTSDTTSLVPHTHLTMPLYYMVAMASFGSLTAVLMGNSERIAKERESGWVRQLRLTALPGRGYVMAKIASAAVATLPAIVVVFVVAAAVKDVRLDAAWQWLALTGAIWAGSLVFAALGVAIGYLASGDAVRPLTMIIYFGLSILGGLWSPTTAYPQWLQNISDYLPTHAYAALGQAIELGGAPHTKDIALLVGYLVLFAGAAAWLYRKDTRKA
ncbi:ABC transporter permease [Streptomyces sp. NBS 14/10]|uniref:ABC transporter permease n=1 Tax=Streptomyces sp. NBS 14/10 TaxID=1945643 RepID=UPI000B7C79F7|nr:ABC transporter permease [Streptomyces sp. NBS 14/10]KAK1181902.1 ABC transporter permease [Streptomyces sp. NBS 14/10]